MPSDIRHDIVWIVLFIIMVGMVGLVMVAFLMAAWRRYNQRLSHTSKHSEPMPDIWQASRDRLVAKMSPYPRPGDREDPKPRGESGAGPGGSDSDPFQDPDDDDDGEPFPGR